MSTVIDGKTLASKLRFSIKQAVSELKIEHNIVPGLAVVLVGQDPASHVYVKSKARQTVEVGMHSFEHRLPENTSENELVDIIEELNQKPEVNGILVQLPLPDQINSERIINTINVNKDVDGFHIENIGRLSSGSSSLVPCTPAGCLILLRHTIENLSGHHAIILGRSNIVGKPVGQLLLKENCTVTIAHSKTRDLPSVCQRADIVIAAVGVPELVKDNWVKPGATVIDVGINRITDSLGNKKLVGDVDYESVSQVAGAITPVPGGVGPMTIACLLQNTIIATCRQRQIRIPPAIE
ncbi:MAG: bifunctional methylenetetrahydrofolate dehydrogenase/methenyltetrahydrofolate cyclohydrolase FolD [Gammaproteobacteria bacterium]|nr:bifunctional methylenetetrahydrofolate dehydrogenase/methenyltetrahydrofolate cyclohydrolase FolD [Gammaproteobacteria bacterium]MCY4219866.1 bifunctional methylenetetrahydrofolate dehydrogenase/methenyltetrahydrofolate cyclohydrolase FolD [Gammaproteobacteria bacterium]MCY4274806.1 bifunctional methylenetetrahydrofolate dehydrogenase/methenyltetrahydrofolate cyclohydrolase FolD [Gammaproteobacteria bacterium]